MRENILDGFYNDPFEIDTVKQQDLDLYKDSVLEAAQHYGTKLAESYGLKYLKKKKSSQFETDLVDNNQQQKIRRQVQNLNQPWDKDQSLLWPAYDAEAFEAFIQSVREDSGQNTGYQCKALLKALEDKYGKQGVSSIPKKYKKQKLVEKSLKDRFSSRVYLNANRKTQNRLRYLESNTYNQSRKHRFYESVESQAFAKTLAGNIYNSSVSKVYTVFEGYGFDIQNQQAAVVVLIKDENTVLILFGKGTATDVYNYYYSDSFTQDSRIINNSIEVDIDDTVSATLWINQQLQKDKDVQLQNFRELQNIIKIFCSRYQDNIAGKMQFDSKSFLIVINEDVSPTALQKAFIETIKEYSKDSNSGFELIRYTLDLAQFYQFFEKQYTYEELNEDYRDLTCLKVGTI